MTKVKNSPPVGRGELLSEDFTPGLHQAVRDAFVSFFANHDEDKSRGATISQRSSPTSLAWSIEIDSYLGE
jgi:hypothetical protein